MIQYRSSQAHIEVSDFDDIAGDLLATEKNRQLTLGLSFIAAALSVMTLLIVRLGSCCSWFGTH